MEFNGFKDFNDLFKTQVTIDNDTENDNQAESPTPHKITRGDSNEYYRRCICNFSLYTEIFGDNPEDPLDEPEAVDKREFKIKLSKSTKKRLRRQRKKKLALSARQSQIKKVGQSAQIVSKKHTKKDLKIIIKKLAKI